MQELTNPPAMNSPYSTVPDNYGAPDAANAPKLGPVIPGTAGGLPQKPGLSVASNPLPNSLQAKQNMGTPGSMYGNMPSPYPYPPSFSQPQGYAGGGMAHAAEKTRQMGRGEDTMLVHMTPAEVNSLQGLAMAHGGSLTINPDTGLPEAGWLGKLLPTLLGVGLSFVPGVNALMAAGIVGAGSTAITGDLGKGLLAGLGAYGGASLGGALGAGGSGAAAGAAGTGAAGTTAAQTGSLLTPAATTVDAAGLSAISNQAAASAGLGTVTPAAALQGVAPSVANMGSIASIPGVDMAPLAIGDIASMPTRSALGQFGSNFASAARSGLGSGTIAKYAPYAAGYGLLANASEAFAPKPYVPEEEKSTYGGPYRQAPRNVRYPTVSPMLSRDSAEFSYFDPVNPYPAVLPIDDSSQYASGGSVERDYGFKMPRDTYTPTKAVGPVAMGGKGGSKLNGLAQRIAEQKAAGKAPTGAYTAKTPTTTPKSEPKSEPVRTPIVTPEQYTPAMGAAVAPRVDPFTKYMNDINFSQRLAEAGASYGKARGGKVHMDDGAFVMDARSVSEIGNGSSNAGIERLMKLGGRPVRGPGDGVSDSVPAKIGGKQEARVARDEVIFSREAVQRLGGSKKLYALMKKAHKARKKAKRGSDTKVAKGLGAL